MNKINILKWFMVIATAAWAAYATSSLLFLAHAFPSPEPAKHDLSSFLSSTQAYVLVFGPVVAALVFLLIAWPEKRGRK